MAVSMMELPAGPTKRIWVDRRRAALRQSAWVIECNGAEIYVQSFVIAFWATEDVDHMVESRQPPEPSLHPDGPAFWIETTAALHYNMEY